MSNNRAYEDCFKNKVVVVTGGTRGIGLAIAQSFAENHARVAICGRSAASVEKALQTFPSREVGLPFGVAADVRHVSEIDRFMSCVEQELGGVDILINNAGVQSPKPSLDVSEDDWDRIIDTNLKGTFFCSQFAAKQMLKKGKGAIVNISSVQAVSIAEGQLPYASSKAAIVQLTRSLAREWASMGIRVNCVAPGSVPTDINREYYSDPANLKRSLKRIPLGRQGRGEEIARAVMFLASEEASYIIGQTIIVDGGWTLV